MQLVTMITRSALISVHHLISLDETEKPLEQDFRKTDFKIKPKNILVQI